MVRYFIIIDVGLFRCVCLIDRECFSLKIDALAAAACKLGALEALIEVAKDTTRSSTKFAVDALDKLLNQCMPIRLLIDMEMLHLPTKLIQFTSDL